MSMNQTHLKQIDEATAILPIKDNKGKPITVIGTAAIRETFDDQTLQQALNSRNAPGVTDLIVNPDAHVGYGAPVGCVLISPTHIYPGPVGVDIKCSMSLLQTDLSTAARNLEKAGLSLLANQLKDLGDAKVLEVSAECDRHG